MNFPRRHWRLILFAFLLIAAIAVYHHTGMAVLSGRRGMAGLVLLDIAFVTFGLPSMPFPVAAGAIYPVPTALGLMLFAINTGALSAFFLARTLGRRAVEELWGSRLADINKRLERGGYKMLFILRLLPFIPFNVINYAAGLSRVKLWHFVLATLIGTIPMTLVHILLGHWGRHWFTR